MAEEIYMTKEEYASDEQGVVKDAKFAYQAGEAMASKLAENSYYLDGKGPTWYASKDTLDGVQETANNAQEAANNAQTSATNAQTSATLALTMAMDKVSKSDVVQTVGVSDTSIMSQNAVTVALTDKVSKTDIVQETGANEDKIMSQKAVTEAISSELAEADENFMLKSVYDTNGNGIVDKADNAEKLGGEPKSYFDNLISAAQKTANEAKAMMTTVGEAATYDANALPSDGWFICDKNIPTFPLGLGAHMFVLQVSYTSAIQIQLAIPYQMTAGNVHTRGSAPIFVRSKFIYTDNQNWCAWQPIQTGDAYSRYGSVNDANNLPWDGWWACDGNTPVAGAPAYVLQQNNRGNTNRKMQIATPLLNSNTLTIYFRLGYTANNSQAWTAWQEMVTNTTFGTHLNNNISASLLNTVISKLNFPKGGYIWGTDEGISGWRTNKLTIFTLGTGEIGAPVVAGPYTTVSTRRSKTAIKDLDLTQARKLLELEPIEYEVKGDDTHAKHYGMIAEDVAEIDGVPVTRDSDGEIVGLDYQSLIAPLIKLIQEQEKRIEKLESQQ